MMQHDVRTCADLSHIPHIPDRITAACGRCGCNWEYERHDALMCPMCAASYTYAYMSPIAPSYVHLEDADE